MHQVYFLQLDCPESLAEFTERIQSTALFFKEKIDKNAVGFLFEEVSDGSLVSKTDNFSLHADNFLEKIEDVFNANKNYFEDGGAFFMSFLIPVDEFMDPIQVDSLEELWENMFIELSSITNTSINIYAYHSEFSDIIKQTYSSGDFDTGMIISKLGDFEDCSESDYLKSEQPAENFPSDEFFERGSYNI